MAEDEASDSEEEELFWESLGILNASKHDFYHLRQLLALVFDKALLQFQQHTVMARDEHLYNPGRIFHEYGWLLMEFVAGEEKLELIHRRDQILKAENE